MQELHKTHDTTYSLVESTHSGPIEVEVGDAKQKDFYPQVKLKKWDNEANFSVRYIDESGDGQSSHESVDESVVWSKGDTFARLYPTRHNDSDGFEFEIVYSEKPTTNTVRFSIQSKGLDFFYQPFLTDEERYDEEIDRPEDVEGSYAVYHQSESGGKYATGKAFHIYRPEAHDDDGRKTWCAMDIADGVLIIAIPQEFLEVATYPVVVDPTFGYDTLGASNSATANTVKVGSFFIAPANGTITKMSPFIGNTSVPVKGAIYSSDLSLLAQSSEENLPSTGSGVFIDLPVSLEILGGTTYGFMFTASTSTKVSMGAHYDTGTTGQGMNLSSTSYPSAWPNPLSTNYTTNDRKYSIYITYDTDDEEDPTPSAPKIKLSGSFVPATAKVKVGGEWVTAVVKRKVGGEWG